VTATDGVEITSSSFDLEVVQGDERGFSILLIIIIIIIILILIILAVLGFLFFRKRKEEEEKVDEESEEIAHIIEDHQKEMKWEKEHYHHHEKSPSVIAASAMEAHAHDHDKHDDLGYQELYGTEPPDMEEDMSEGEPKETPEGAEEQMKPPEEEEEEHYLEDLISHMTKTTSNIETYGQELKSINQELKSVEDPYDHQGENEEDIEK
jgi:FtsZ-interacting cell division protein ZipA